jgi:2'-5' RNA ligase
MNQYAIIIVPPAEICEMVDIYRKRYAQYTSYVIVPHFTVYPSFFIEKGDEKSILQLLKDTFKGTQSETIKLEKISFFDGKNNVAFFEPDINSSEFIKGLLVKATKLLSGMVKNVYDDYNFTPDKFKPHMTIAEKIPNDIFQDVKNELNKLEKKGSFLVSSVYLFKQQDNSNFWNKVDEILFSSDR